MEEILDFVKTLYNDVEKSIQELNNHSNEDFGYRARSYLRAYASWVEGNVFYLKEIIRKIEYQWHKELPTASQIFLFEYDFFVKNSGEPVLEAKKIGTQANIKGLFYVGSQLFPSFNFSLSTSEWESVLYFYRLRDSMMHPKVGSSVLITKESILKCESGRLWLKGKFGDLQREIVSKIPA